MKKIITSIWGWLRRFSPGDAIALVALAVSGINMYQIGRVDQKFSGNGNVSYTNCTISHPANSVSDGYPDHALAKLSSNRLSDHTLNYLRLNEKTVLELPEEDRSNAFDMTLRIDVGDKVYPIGIDMRRCHVDLSVNENDFLRGVTNSYVYVFFTSAGLVFDGGKNKRNWLASSIAPNRSYGRQSEFGRVKSDGTIERAPSPLSLDGILWWNATPDMYCKAGYKEIVSESPKNIAPEGFYYGAGRWSEQSEKIVMNFELKKIEAPVAPSYGELKSMVDEVNERIKLLSKLEDKAVPVN